MFFPSHLRRLSERISDGISPEELVDGHTLYPYFRPFWTDDLAVQIREDMIGGRGIATYVESGVTASKVDFSTSYKLCPFCVVEDVRYYGEPYWHRQHQLPGVVVCSTHHVRLRDECPVCRVKFHAAALQEYLVPLTHCLKGHSLLESVLTGNELEIQVAKDSTYVLATGVPFTSLEDIQNAYINALYAEGLATVSGRVRQRQLFDEFKQRFSIDFIHRLGVNWPDDTEWSWLRKIVRKPDNALHPIYHILLMEFLSGSVPAFIARRHFAPFGTGPWPCLNRVATHHLEPVVTELVVTRCSDTGLPVGTFTCTLCGFSYSRRGPDQFDEDKYRYGRIKEFGDLWRENLRDLYHAGKSVGEIATITKMDSRVIEAHLNRQLNAKTGESISTTITDIMSLRRQRILDTIRDNPTATRHLIQKSLNPKDYTWLSRHDRDWLMTALPPPQDKSRHLNVTQIDWRKRDEELVILITRCVNSIRNDDRRPTRITISKIGRLIGKQALLTHNLHKLPKTHSVIKKCTETKQEYHMRLVDWAIKQLSLEPDAMVVWRVIRKAGMRTPVSKELLHYVNIMIDRSNQARECTLNVVKEST